MNAELSTSLRALDIVVVLTLALSVFSLYYLHATIKNLREILIAQQAQIDLLADVRK